MKGWTTKNFKERRFHHHRSMGTAERSLVQASFDYGVKDYFMGGSPLWQIFRSAYRMRNPHSEALPCSVATLGGCCDEWNAQ